MKQAHLIAPRQIELREFALPEPRAGEMLVKIRAALTCGTDLKTYRRGHPRLQFGPFGHEASGDVVAVGEGVKRFSPGEAVMWVQTAPCGRCARCASGSENLCERLFEEIALGAYADYLVLPRRVVEVNVFRKPANLSYVEAAFLEPFACVVHGWNVIKRADTRRPIPRSVAIIGAGTIGMLHLLYAAHAGVPATVFARRDDRRDLAIRLGAAGFVLADEKSAATTDAAAFDAVIESAGTAQSWQQAIALTSPGGRVLLFGGLPKDTKVSIDATRVHYEELALLGAFHFTPADVAQTRDLLVSGEIDMKPLISGIEPLALLPSVFERLDRRDGYKYALIPEPAPAQWV